DAQRLAGALLGPGQGLPRSGCFVLCVTPTSAVSSDSAAGGSGARRRAAAISSLARDTVRRTRAGAVSGAVPLAGFLHRGQHGVIGVGGERSAGAVVGARGLECRAGDGERWRSDVSGG
ncbi:unnamed protein product, partial [Sphacelaria rigidula]